MGTGEAPSLPDRQHGPAAWLDVVLKHQHTGAGWWWGWWFGVGIGGLWSGSGWWLSSRGRQLLTAGGYGRWQNYKSETLCTPAIYQTVTPVSAR